MAKDLPIQKLKSRELSAPYSLWMTPEMKRRLTELKTFDGVDVPTWIRSLIDRELRRLAAAGSLKSVSYESLDPSNTP